MSETGVNYSGKKVVIGLTGRIASCVAALLLKKQGMKVIGVSIVTAVKEEFTNNSGLPTCHIQDLEKVKSFCESLNIPFYATDAKAYFDAEVIDPLVASKLTAKANTACFNCNTLRLNILYDKMIKLGADYISTGHFCKVQKNLNSDEYFIHANNDPSSDQSFLLGGVNSKVLSHLILPLGELKSEEVKKIADRFELPYTKKKKNKNYCFDKPNEYIDIIKKRVPKKMLEEGTVQNIDTDIMHGDHDGIVNYNIGDNELSFKGINPSDKDIEIVDYDFVRKIIYIGSSSNLTSRGVQLVNLKFAKGLDLTKPMLCFIKNKFSKKAVKCHLYFKNNQSAFLEIQEDIYPLILEERFILLDRDGRNAKIIGNGQLGGKGDFKLIDRVKDFRNDQEGKEEAKPTQVVEIFKF